MNTCDKNYGCLSCGDPCRNKCTEAAYACDFDITAAPYDPTTWYVTWCGKMHEVKIPTIAETDTTLSTNYSNATLNYKAERHEDILTGEQLGSLIRVEDLRDTNCDYTTEAMCYELIYHKYGECGDGCMALENEWATFSVDSPNALKPQIHFVRGANVFGCPEYLDVPTNVNQYWFAGWRTDTQQFGYYQAQKVQELPKDSLGNYVVLSRNPGTQEPVVGIIPWQCMLENIFGNLGVKIEGIWREVQGTPGFSAKFNQITGDWQINWTDWNDVDAGRVAGYGQVTGKVNWTTSFDATTGSMRYNITGVYYDQMTWTVVEGVLGSVAPKLTLKGMPLTGGSETLFFSDFAFGKSTVSKVINETIQTNQIVTVGPNQTIGPFDFLYILVDWIGDDEGYMGIQFGSNLSGWQNCPPGDF